MLILGGKSNLSKEELEGKYVAYIFLFPHKEVIVLLFLSYGLNSGKQRIVLSFFNSLGYFYNTMVQLQSYNL